MSDNTTKLVQALVDQGKIIEAGWVSYLHNVMPASAGAVQIEETRRAFYASAHHLFASIMTMLEPGAEPTEKDMRRLDHINNELRAFAASLSIRGRN
jgi:hypothetical protein